jgi:hypothetical protein
MCENLGFPEFIYLEKIHQPKSEAITNTEKIEKQLTEKHHDVRVQGSSVLKFAE